MKLRIFESISIDGFYTDLQGDIAWAHSGREDPEFGAWVGANAKRGGILLFGRNLDQAFRVGPDSPHPIAALLTNVRRGSESPILAP